jgi:hypothetical protein
MPNWRDCSQQQCLQQLALAQHLRIASLRIRKSDCTTFTIQSYCGLHTQHAIDGPEKQLYWLQKQYPDLLDADAMLALLVANDYDVAGSSRSLITVLLNYSNTVACGLKVSSWLSVLLAVL